MNQPTPTLPTPAQLDEAVRNYFTSPEQQSRVDFRGPSPAYGLACRVCWLDIAEGVQAVDTGYAPFHEACHTALTDYVREAATAYFKQAKR